MNTIPVIQSSKRGQNTAAVILRSLLALSLLIAVVCLGSGCTKGVSGTYQGQIYVTTNNASNLRVTEFTLQKNGNVTAKADDETLGLKVELSIGSYSTEGEHISMHVGKTFLTGTIEGDTMALENDQGSVSVFRKQFLTDEMIVTVIVLYLLVVAIQSVLVYTLIARRIRESKESVTGRSLRGSLALYRLAALIPGSVLIVWFKERKHDRNW